VKLNYPEAVALLCDEIIEVARDGRSMEEASEVAINVLRRADVMDGVRKCWTNSRSKRCSPMA
jgi:urease gamma subunit